MSTTTKRKIPTLLDIERRKKIQDIEDMRQRLMIDKVYALKAVLVGVMLDEGRPFIDGASKPMMPDEGDIITIRKKIMEIVKQF